MTGFVASLAPSGNPIANATAGVLAASVTAVTDAIAVLVADAASPTQAHVTTLNAAYALLLPQINASVASGGVYVQADVSAITSVSKLRTVFNEIERAALSAGLAA